MVLESHYLTDGQLHCINGNHRINEAYRQNKEEIDVYVFKELEFVPFFYDTLSKAIYYFETDYSNVMRNERRFLNGKQTNHAVAFKRV